MNNYRSIYDKPLQSYTLPFSNDHLNTVERLASFHSNLFQNVIFYSYDHFEIKILATPFQKENPEKLKKQLMKLNLEEKEKLLLQYLALQKVSQKMDLNYFNFNTFNLQSDLTLQFPIAFNSIDQKSRTTLNFTDAKLIKYLLSSNTPIDNKKLQKTFINLKSKHCFSEEQLYIYNCKDFASNIINTYPITDSASHNTIKIKINTHNPIQKQIIKNTLFNNFRSKNIYWCNINNSNNNLPDIISHLPSKEIDLNNPFEDYVSIINYWNIFLEKSSYGTLFLLLDRLKTREDKEFIHYFLETSNIGNFVFICFDKECNSMDFDLELNEKPKNHLKYELDIKNAEPDEIPVLTPEQKSVLKIIYSLPAPVSLKKLKKYISSSQYLSLKPLIQKKLLKLDSDKLLSNDHYVPLNINVSKQEEIKLLKRLLEKDIDNSLNINMKYYLLTRQMSKIKKILKLHLIRQGKGIELDLKGIKKILIDQYIFFEKQPDLEILELLVSLLVIENDFKTAKKIISDYSEINQSLILKLKLAYIYNFEKEYSKMGILLDEIKNEKQLKNIKNSRDEFNYLCFVYHEKVDEINFNKADQYLKKIKSRLYLARTSLLISDRHLYKGEFHEAEALIKKAIDFFHQANYQVDEMEALSHLAKLKRERNEIQESEKLYQNLFIRGEMKNYNLLSAYIAVDLGNLYWAKDQYDTCEIWYKKALQKFQAHNNENGIALAKANLMEINKIKGNWTETKKQLENILAFNKQRKSITSLAIDYFNMGHLEYLRHRYDRAIDFVEIAQPIFEKNSKHCFITECELLKLKTSFIEKYPDKIKQLNIEFFKNNLFPTSKDQQILLSIIEIAKNDPLNKKYKLISEKIKQIQSKTAQFDLITIVIIKYKRIELLEILKSLSIQLNNESKNYYYYEFLYIYYNYFFHPQENTLIAKEDNHIKIVTNENKIQQKIKTPKTDEASQHFSLILSPDEEKNRFYDTYYFFQRNQRKLSSEFIKHKHYFDETESLQDIFNSAELVSNYMHWNLPEDFFKSLIKSIRNIIEVDLIKLMIYERKDMSKGPLFNFSTSTSDNCNQVFQSLTNELITRAVFSSTNLNLRQEEVKLQSKNPGKAFYFYANTKVLLWNLSEELFGGLLLAFSSDKFFHYDFNHRHSNLLKKFGSLIHRYYTKDYQVNQKLNFIIGESPPIQHLKENILRVSDVDFPVLIIGESGSGKELVAKGIHLLSNRSNQPFVPVNAAAIPENLLEPELFGFKRGAFTGANENKIGLIESAHNGTLFLDEIADLPLNLQAKLLRVLQEKEIRRLGENKTKSVNLRLICATNKDIKKLMAENKFRSDLYYRIQDLEIYVPPLRDRLDDIPLLLQHFLTKYNFSIEDKEKLKQISSYFRTLPWNGNVRELESNVKRLITYYPDFEMKHQLNADNYSGTGLITARENLEKSMIINALKENNWSRKDAALSLKITRQHLFNLIKKYKI